MGYCKKCFDHFSGDCILSNGRCVFCHYGTQEWESNGRVIPKKEALENWGKLFLVWRNYFRKYSMDLKRAIKHSPKGISKDRLKKKLVKTERLLNCFNVSP